MDEQVRIINTSHEDTVHDAQMDYYGTKLATCSSDKTIKIFHVDKNKQTFAKQLVGHEGPVWQLAWAHPKFGTILASCSYDKKIFIWKEVNGQWNKIYEYAEHSSSVNSVSWAPYELGLILLAGSSDGSISIHTYDEDNQEWEVEQLENVHPSGCNGVSWGPALSGSWLLNPKEMPQLQKKFVSCGSDMTVQIHEYSSDDKFVRTQQFEAHADVIRDVAWSQGVIEYGENLIASSGHDGKVVIYTEKNGKWETERIYTYDNIVWHVSWSLLGNFLAVSCSNNLVNVWRRNDSNDKWIMISEATG